ncbi:MAG TPA: nucleotidyltransferase [Deltaproteobacteria bacterium]|nr:nucleotidyltransferase [Deltaproteobacteria bacterium]
MFKQVTTKDDIITRILGEKEQLVRFGVVSIGLFGSFVRGDQNSSSDVDILLEFTPDKHTFDNFMEVSFLLEDLLGRKVEIVTRESLSPHIGPLILKEVVHVPIAA